MFATNERGVGLVAVLIFIFVLATLGLTAMVLTVEDMHGAAAQTDSEAALYVAHAGLAYGVKKFVSAASSVGGTTVTRPVGRGSFTATAGTTDENGNPLPAGEKMVRSTGTVGTAVRSVRRFISTGAGATATVYASGEGDAVSIQSQKKFVDLASIADGSAPNGTWGHGGFNSADNQTGDFGSFAATGLSGSVQTVEAALYGYLTGALGNDQTQVKVYFNNAVQGGAFILSATDLNAHVGAGNAGWWYVDVTSARSWSLSDFTGDLEIYVLNDKVGSDDGPDLYLDSIGYRVTVTGAPGAVAGSFKEIVL